VNYSIGIEIGVALPVDYLLLLIAWVLLSEMSGEKVGRL
jgi:hypothetical protein